MISIQELQDGVKDGLKAVLRDSAVKQAEVFASSNALTTLRLSVASNIPSNALEEAKTFEDYGLSVRVLLKNGSVGFGKESNALDAGAVKSAFQKAKKSSVKDPHFQSFPSPSEKPRLKDYADARVLALDEEKAIASAYAALDGCMQSLSGKRVEFNITGELDFLGERMAVANSNGVLASDESSIAWSHIACVIEGKKDVAGMHFDSSTHLGRLNPFEIGKNASEKALSSLDAAVVDGGTYAMVLGPQAITDLLTHIFDPNLSSVDMQSTPLAGKLDQRVASESVSIEDNALLEGSIGTKAVTDEGLAATRTPIVERGVLKNFLSDDYFSKKFAKKEDETRYNARNGFRFSGFGRNYDAEPSVYATNMVVAGGNASQEELFETIGNGLYVDKIWYTYPVNGSMVSDFSSTIRGNSFIIRNGKLQRPLLPNTLRISDSLDNLFNNVLAIGKEQKPGIEWGGNSVIISPELAVKSVRVQRIAKGLY